MAELERQIESTSREQVIEKVAYTWFNRFCALRFMDVNGYTRVRVVSPTQEDQIQPEILTEAKMGNIDPERVPDQVRQQIAALLSGTATSRDPQQEAYRLLVVAECNSFHRAMPYLFERIADYTELLMPDDLLSGNAILSATRAAMTPDACQDVEVIGWLYQFYISEKKDQVFDGLKKGKKISPENIPAATQLFTPHWIVRYLVENALGRLWMLNHPGSRLVEQMDYYIKPEPSAPAETDFLRIARPEDLKLCDPACGSGHMLTYAFDLLYAIYEESGTDASEIPQKILSHNLYGIELDQRAGDLAAFALTMKARARQRRFFSKAVAPSICVLEKISFSSDELDEYADVVGQDLFTPDLRATLLQFDEADNFGSLIRPKLANVQQVLPLLQATDMGGQLFLKSTHDKVLQVLRQADYLRQQYQVVVANPPYMGSKGMNARLGAWLKSEYPDVKSDLFSAFIVRNTELTVPKGQLGFMSPFVWMFISSYEKLRDFLISQKTITSLIQLEYSGFDGATVPICTFTLENAHHPDFKGGYVRLSDFRGSENQAPKTLEAIKNPDCGWYFRASSADFKKIPGSPIAYWVSLDILDAFERGDFIDSHCSTRKGMATGKNANFVRNWPEVSVKKIGFGVSRHAAKESIVKWFPYANGGEYRKWYGNYDDVVDWENDGERLQTELHENGLRVRAVNLNLEFIFKEGLSWTSITSASFSIRHLPCQSAPNTFH